MSILKFAPLALLVAAPPALAQAPEIVRNGLPPPANILKSVKLPAETEIVMLSGELAAPIDPANRTGIEAYGDTRTQTVSVLERIKATLARDGYAMSDIVRLSAYLVADPRTGKVDYDGYGAAYAKYFGSTENPNLVARTTMQIAGLVTPYHLIEIEVIAAKVKSR